MYVSAYGPLLADRRRDQGDDARRPSSSSDACPRPARPHRAARGAERRRADWPRRAPQLSSRRPRRVSPAAVDGCRYREVAGELVVVDADTGAVLLRRPRVDGLTPQAFQPGRLGAARQRRGDGSCASCPAAARRPCFARRVAGVLRRHGPGRDHLGAAADPDRRRGGPRRRRAPRSAAWGADGEVAYVVSGAPEGCAYRLRRAGPARRRALREWLVEPAAAGAARWRCGRLDGRRLAVDLAPPPRVGPAREAPPVAEARRARLRDVQRARGRRDAPDRAACVAGAAPRRHAHRRAAARAARLRRGRRSASTRRRTPRWWRSSATSSIAG